MKDKNIGFIGLGNVGSLLANRLIKSNLNLYIYDINKKSAKKLIQKGAIWKKSIEEVRK